ncbi:ribitol-5-phosphate 2-dehydrogenase [Staphylococcus aureus]|uniref:Ribitol-5-phosphate 2-dehydrogenase n=1 Tax=Staphylococcus aureus TaxID=1280 RepID=A0A2X2MAT3_STAAU|nr:ribitol-5-phosphate 2-dehydrogenase [Staphylococcus aureus]
MYPEAKIYVFGKTDYKLSHFSFVDDIFTVNQIPDDLKIDHAFECVGGKGSQVALQQIVEHISPEGSIALLGVSELPVEVNTRLVLEKGLTLIGSSRSGSKDFEQVVDLYRKYPDIVEKVSLIKRT